MKNERTYQYKGQTIRRDAFRFRVTSRAQGDVTGQTDDYYVPSFKTLGAAKDYIDRTADESR